MSHGSYHWREAGRYMVTGMIVATLLVGAKLLVEATPVGVWAEQQTRELLLKMLPSFRSEGLDAIVVDISHFAGGEADLKDGRLKPTSRPLLKELLDTLVELKPAAIGIDVDFSTNGEGWLDPRDPAFFDHCLTLNRRVPIRLGVWRSIPDPSGLWLDAPDYTPLAAALLVTDAQSGRLPIWAMPPGSEKKLLSLGAALVDAIPSSPLEPLLRSKDKSALRRFAFEDVAERQLPIPMKTLTVRTFESPVNYSVVPQMYREFIPRAEARELSKFAERIEGRVVLIGAALKTTDMFSIPGYKQNFPGVFLHAAQVHTLSSEHVREFSHGFRVVLDLLISFGLLLSVVVWRWRVAQGHAFAAGPLPEHRVVWAGSVLVIVLGVILVAGYGIFWLDFLLVVLFTLLHRPAEHVLLSQPSH